MCCAAENLQLRNLLIMQLLAAPGAITDINHFYALLPYFLPRPFRTEGTLQ